MPLLRLLPPLAVAIATLALAPSAGAWKQLDPQVAPAAPSLSKATPQQVLQRAERAFATGGDLSPLLRRLALDLPRLSGAEKQRAAGLLARPTDGDADPQQ